METFTVRRDDATIPVTVSGDGPPAVFVPGLSTTQADLGQLLESLREFFRLATFDLRGHGLSSHAARYDYASFAADAAAVMAALGAPESSVLMGHSLGADLVLDHAAALPEGPRALILIDGAAPTPRPLLTEDELAVMHESLSSEEALHTQRSLAGTPRQQLLSADDVMGLLREVEAHRRSSAERFDQVDRPVTMIMSETMAGTSGDRARELNTAWREAVDVLAAGRPSITVRRVPAGHDLVVTHPEQVLAHILAAGAHH
ncbi:alpha/beta hydrolase [Streptomyces canus]|uniref:alpha/beta fold hydrolase n=1 Tax=Streptomyces canus TaxID=58343 RepID=UPI002E2E1862|nr:alpha/beta hydrolase [Streptomyces canus]